MGTPHRDYIADVEIIGAPAGETGLAAGEAGLAWDRYHAKAHRASTVCAQALELWPDNGYNLHMSKHSVVEAKNQLSELIDRSLKGEDVVITRHGRPVAELKPVARTPRAVTAEDLDWLVAHRARLTPNRTDAGTLISRIRTEDWT